KIKLRQDVTQARRQAFTPLQTAAERDEAGIGGHCECSRELRQALIVAMRSARCTRRGAHQTRRAQSRAERTQQIAPGVAQMRRERIVKGILILVREDRKSTRLNSSHVKIS